jgi:hypothetical protein
MSSVAIKQKDILVTNANCTRAGVRASSMAWRAPFPRSGLPASVEIINKASMCGSRSESGPFSLKLAFKLLDRHPAGAGGPLVSPCLQVQVATGPASAAVTEP